MTTHFWKPSNSFHSDTLWKSSKSVMAYYTFWKNQSVPQHSCFGKSTNPWIPHFPKPFITSFSDWFTNIGLFLLVWWWKMDSINSNSMHKRQIHFPIFLNLDWSFDLFWLISILQKCQASPLGVWQLPLSFSKLVNGKSTTSLRSPICEETQATEDETPRCWTYEWSFSDLPA